MSLIAVPCDACLTAVPSPGHHLRRATSEGTNGGRAGSALLRTLGDV